MSNLTADWRDRPTHRRVWALAAPMILSNISVPLVALVDSTVIGHLPHAHQLGAVAGSPPRRPGAGMARPCGRFCCKACCSPSAWPWCWVRSGCH
jgi:hypothetical protein